MKGFVLKISILSLILWTSVLSSSAQDSSVYQLYPLLTNQFYSSNHQQLFWFGNSSVSDTMRMILLQKLDSSEYIGIDNNNFDYAHLLSISKKYLEEPNDTLGLKNKDMLYTNAAIVYCKYLYQGCEIKKQLLYDEWSEKYETRDNNFLIDKLAAVRTTEELLNLFKSLEPNSKEYQYCKADYTTQYNLNNPIKAKQLALYLDFYRWVHHFNFKKFIVVNIPSATLKYYVNDTISLFSKMIVGKRSTRTPRFDATCREVVLYPYWNVPQDITARELFPKYKKSPALINEENMQVIDKKGNIINPASVKWSQYSGSTFPYRFRQSTGCDNSLGVIKFNLTTPFEVYLHDTNEKGLYKSNSRFRSHGCMRVEKAIELGNYLLNNKLDTVFLEECLKNEKPVTIPLENPIPVFVVYLTADINDSNKINYFEDVYHLSR